MNPRPFGAAGVAIPVLILSLAGCGGGSGAGGTPAGSITTSGIRPFRPVVEDRWAGNAICYGPYRDGQRPGGPVPSSAEIRDDLALMASHWSLLRTYGASEFGRELLEEIRAGGLSMKVVLGVWIAAEDIRDADGQVIGRRDGAVDANRREIEAAIALAGAYPDIVVAVCVGNETQVHWSPYPCPLDLLIGAIREVRAAVSVPVTTADDYQYWNLPESRVLAAEVDFLMVHAHPMWNGQQLDEAMPWLRAQVAGVMALHPQRQVVIGETGWATSVARRGEEARLIKGVPGEAEQAAFYHDVRAWADSARVATFVFEAFDERWKGGDDPAEVEKHWGLFRADRSAKKALRDGGPR